jgi:hypothetical protein
VALEEKAMNNYRCNFHQKSISMNIKSDIVKKLKEITCQGIEAQT